MEPDIDPIRIRVSISNTTVTTSTVRTINGSSTLINLLNVIPKWSFSANPTAMISVLEPVSAQLLPKFALNNNAHHNGLTLKESKVEAITELSLSESITGIIEAVSGILSTNALENADDHTIITKVY
jgi:hypothetical protein